MSHCPIHEMVRQAARKHGDRIAIEWRDQRITYRQLERRFTNLAVELVAAGLEPEALVGIHSSRTTDVVVAILAVLEAGGVFVPFDPRFPSIRLDSALEHIRPEVWLVGEEGADELVATLQTAGLENSVHLALDDALWRELEDAEAVPTQIVRNPDGLCSVFFTSGSTGRSKAIGGRFQAIDHFIQWHIETFKVVENSRVGQVAAFGFDAFLREVLVPLAAGGTLVVPEDRQVVLDAEKIISWLEATGVTHLHCTPSHFRSFFAEDRLEGRRLPDLRYLLLVGEAVLPADVKRLHSVFGQRIQLVNLYGPTETTLTKFFHLVRAEDANAITVPIGKPMPGVRAVVVGENGKVCPPGKLGEILIRTPYRSLGYLGDPERTAQVFVPNPFGSDPEDLVYKTGDLARLREDGDFEFVGRRDHQVKVRGVRVELLPVENLLSSHPAVAVAAVAPRIDSQGNQFLCAYLELRKEVSIDLLEKMLREQLPPAAVPSTFVVVDSLPRLATGKINRRALADLEARDDRQAAEYVAPRTPLESRLCEMFAELLRVEKVGIQDHFFKLGGHSLLVMQLLARIRDEFLALPLAVVFQTPTVEGLALEITQRQMEQVEDAAIADLLAQVEGEAEGVVAESVEEGDGKH